VWATGGNEKGVGVAVGAQFSVQKGRNKRVSATSRRAGWGGDRDKVKTSLPPTTYTMKQIQTGGKTRRPCPRSRYT